jgi:exopolyphosphatase/guanosine-5'-triphosphate,3'-diphosphate pyrophosphatase
MEAKRVDVIVAGSIILEQALLGLGIDELRISSYALREGIVFDTVQKDDDIRRFHHLAHLRYESVDHVCELYRVRRPHADHVKNLAVRLFDGLRMLHGYGDRELELLEAAALLHDVGFHIGADQHHKHSEYIIRNSAMPGFTNDETEIIASIARYHRKSHPKKKHATFMALTLEEQQVVRVLAAILRIAEGLDRRQQQLVQRIRVDVSSDGIDMYLVVPNGLADMELWGAERRKELLEETLHLPVRFVMD